MTAPTEQKKIITLHIYPPIPIRDFDWIAVFDGYDLGDPVGAGATEKLAIADLMEIFSNE